MRLEFNVYTSRAEPISIDDIVQRAATKGSSVRWTPSPFTEHAGPAQWIAGAFTPQAGATPRVVAGRELLRPGGRQEAIDTHGDVLTPAQRQLVLDAGARYGLALEDEEESAEGQRLLIHLVDSIADFGGGLIQDVRDDRFEDAADFRRRYASMLGAQG